MKLTKFALDRPVTVLMIFLAIVLIGFISWQRLSLELLPSLNYPQITVLTSYENVAPPEMESLISRPIEEALGSIKGVKRISSISREGFSLVTLDFEWGVDTSLAALDVREKLDVIQASLPKESEKPILVKFDPSTLPIMTLGLSGQASLDELSRIAADQLKHRFERVPGIALARIGGGVEREIVVAVDQGRLFAYGIPISAVVEKLEAANFNFPGGSIEKGKKEIRIRTIGQFEKLADLSHVVLSKTDNEVPVFLRDVASISDTFKNPTSAFIINGNKSIGISIFKQADSNTVSVADQLLREINALNQELHPRVNITVVYNQAAFIRESIADLQMAGILGGILAFTVLLLFLRSFNSALIVTTAIPISVLGVFTLMYTTGITLNIMSLGGLALGVGLLVDNGIVILENIHRHRMHTAETYQAVIRGTEEMQNPVIASTLAHIIVFLPIIFVKGLAGKFFSELALTISFSLLISILVALLLNPMLEANRGFHLRKSTPNKADSIRSRSFPGYVIQIFQKALAPLWGIVDKIMRLADNLYVKMIALALNNRITVLLSTFGLVVLSISLLPFMGKEFIPDVDQGNFLIRLTTPMGTSLKATERAALQIEELILKAAEVKDVFVNMGHDAIEKTEKALADFETNSARITVILNRSRQRSVDEVVNDLRPKVSKISDIRVEYVLNQNIAQILRQRQEAGEILEINGPDLETIRNLTHTITGKLQGIECLKDVKSNLGGMETEIQISVDREKAASFKLSVKQIADTLKTALEGETATKFYDADKDIDIVVKLRDKDRNDISKLEKVLIYSPLGKNIPLMEAASISLSSRLRQIQHRDLKRVSVISANIIGVPYSEGMEKIKRAIDQIPLPPEHYITFSDDQREMDRSFRNLMFALVFSMVLVYMLLASLFESFLNPFIIMFAVPLAAVGVILILFITAKPISLGVYIGSIMLGGIVVNNSIILLDYMDRLIKKGLSRKDAIIQGGRTRLRPILMTALTTILGLIPLATGFGGGSEIRSPLALTVIGGLSTSTFMTLVVIPVIYSLFGRFTNKKSIHSQTS